MCNCTSCEYTDSFSNKGFDAWPKGAPKGARKSSAEYAAHVAFGKRGLSAAIPFKPGAAPWFRHLGEFVPPAPLPQKYLAIIARGSIINHIEVTA